MNLRQDVEKFFETFNRSISLKELIKRFNVSYDEIDKLIDILFEIECEGKIIGNNYNEYIHVPEDFYLSSGVVKLSSKNNFYINMENGGKIILSGKETKDLKEGDFVFVETKKSNKHKLQLLGTIRRIAKKAQVDNKSYLYKAYVKKSNGNNYCYIEINDKRFYILNNELNGAFVGDLVTVEIFEKEKNGYAKVKEVLERKNKKHVFEYANVAGEYKWVPINGTYFDFNFKYSKDEYKVGDRVLLEFDNSNNAKFIKRIDSNNSLYNNIKALAYDAGLNVDFSDDTLKEASNIPFNISEQEIEKRLDLRNLPTITIDPTNAMDLDDAVSLEKLDDRYRLYVSIADVSHYVKVGSAIFKDAVEHGLSCYPSNYVFPMLPEKLSNEVCSLKPNEDKLTKTCIIDIDFLGNILDAKFVKSIIKTDFKMSYEKVNSLLEGTSIDTDYIPYYSLLIEMNNLSNILQKRRLDRGFLCFESDEVEFDLDSDGNVLGIHMHSKGTAQLLIENFMLLANEMIADLAFNLDIPFVYRNHESPDINKIMQLKNKISVLRKYIITLNNAQNPKMLQKIFLTICNGKSSYEIKHLSKILLKNMNRAFYSSINFGHYGLALNDYATFTSPIRRLPDLLNHIMLDYIIESKYEEIEKFAGLYSELANLSTKKQLEIEEFEQNINNILMQKYANEFIGHELVGYIIFIVDTLVYIQTKEGLYGYIVVNKSNLKKNVLRLKENTYEIGSPIVVMVDHVKIPSNEIVFTYVGNYSKEKDEIRVLEKRINND